MLECFYSMNMQCNNFAVLSHLHAITLITVVVHWISSAYRLRIFTLAGWIDDNTFGYVASFAATAVVDDAAVCHADVAWLWRGWVVVAGSAIVTSCHNTSFTSRMTAVSSYHDISRTPVGWSSTSIIALTPASVALTVSALFPFTPWLQMPRDLSHDWLLVFLNDSCNPGAS